MEAGVGSGYREAPPIPPPFEHVGRLPRSWIWLNAMGGLIAALVLAWVGDRHVELHCTRAATAAPVATCDVTATTLLGGLTQRASIPRGARSAVLERRAGRSYARALGFRQPGAAQAVPLTPFADGPIGGDDFARMDRDFDRFLQDPTLTEWSDRSSPSGFFIGLAIFLGVSGLVCAMVIARWRRTIRVVRGPSPRIELDFVGFVSRTLRAVPAGPGATIEAQPRDRGLAQLVLRRRDGTTEGLTLGRQNDPRLDALVAQMNEALR